MCKKQLDSFISYLIQEFVYFCTFFLPVFLGISLLITLVFIFVPTTVSAILAWGITYFSFPVAVLFVTKALTGRAKQFDVGASTPFQRWITVGIIATKGLSCVIQALLFAVLTVAVYFNHSFYSVIPKGETFLNWLTPVTIAAIFWSGYAFKKNVIMKALTVLALGLLFFYGLVFLGNSFLLSQEPDSIYNYGGLWHVSTTRYIVMILSAVVCLASYFKLKELKDEKSRLKGLSQKILLGLGLLVFVSIVCFFTMTYLKIQQHKEKIEPTLASFTLEPLQKFNLDEQFFNKLFVGIGVQATLEQGENFELWLSENIPNLQYKINVKDKTLELNSYSYDDGIIRKIIPYKVVIKVPKENYQPLRVSVFDGGKLLVNPNILIEKDSYGDIELKKEFNP